MKPRKEFKKKLIDGIKSLYQPTNQLKPIINTIADFNFGDYDEYRPTVYLIS